MIHFQAQTLKQYCYKSDLWLILRRLVNQIHFQSGDSVNPKLFYVIPIIVDYFIFWYNLAYVKLSSVVSVQLWFSATSLTCHLFCQHDGEP